jgi:c-di-GMP-binding flagellar brake protein YcgR
MGWRKWFFPGRVHTQREPVPVAPAERPNRRRDQRVSAFLPVFIYAYSQREPFVEHTVTLNVSAGGGLLSLSHEVAPSQELLLANTQTEEERRCRIVRVLKMQGGTTLVGFEFLRSSPRFWSIEFKP